MARWTASAKWAAGPALDGRRGMPLALRLSEWLGLAALEPLDDIFILVVHSSTNLYETCLLYHPG